MEPKLKIQAAPKLCMFWTKTYVFLELSCDNTSDFSSQLNHSVIVKVTFVLEKH